MNWTKELIVKYVTLAALALGGAWLVVPFLLKIAIDALTLAILGIVGMALFYLLPAIAEALSLLGIRLWELVIKMDPISRLKKDLAGHSKQIEDLEERIAEANAEFADLKDLFRRSKPNFSPEQIGEWQERLTLIETAGRELVSLRDEEVKKHQEFEMVVKNEEAEYNLGRAFKRAMGAFSFAKKVGPGTTGSSVAIEAVRKQLAISQSRIALVLSRPKELGQGGMTDEHPSIDSGSSDRSAGARSSRVFQKPRDAA